MEQARIACERDADLSAAARCADYQQLRRALAENRPLGGLLAHHGAGQRFGLSFLYELSQH